MSARGLLLGTLAGGAALALLWPSIAPAYVVPDQGGPFADDPIELPPTPAGPDNLGAFLRAIQWAEGTSRHADPYRVLYGHAEWTGSLAAHPAEQGWPGVRLTDVQCRGAGLGPGCVSTAAGAYQMIRPTWRRLSARLRLPDFSADSQDAGAIELLREGGALPAIERGEFAAAVYKVRRVWASLPGAGYAGQSTRSLAELQSFYLNSGGALA